MTIEEAMTAAMTSKECYAKPEAQKKDAISEGVSAITDAVKEQKRKNDEAIEDKVLREQLGG